MVPFCAVSVPGRVGDGGPRGLSKEREAARAHGQLRIPMETICCLINLLCEMWQRLQPSEQRGIES